MIMNKMVVPSEMPPVMCLLARSLVSFWALLSLDEDKGFGGGGGGVLAERPAAVVGNRDCRGSPGFSTRPEAGMGGGCLVGLKGLGSVPVDELRRYVSRGGRSTLRNAAGRVLLLWDSLCMMLAVVALVALSEGDTYRSENGSVRAVDWISS